MTKKLGVILLAIALLIIVFLMGRVSAPKVVETSKKEDRSKIVIDSVLSINKDYQDSVRIAYSIIDSLNANKVTNIKKVKDDIIKIKDFTPVSRIRWRDSVRLANGL